MKVHSHPGGLDQFLPIDDFTDHELFASIHLMLDDSLPHASVIMLPSGELFGRAIMPDDHMVDLYLVMVTGDDLQFWNHITSSHRSPSSLRHAQAFGQGTIDRLRSMSAAIVGCSGTGSIVVEQLARLGMGRLVLIDDDVVEEKNLNRILNATKEDAYLRRPKVEVLARAVARMGLDQEVIPLQL